MIWIAVFAAGAVLLSGLSILAGAEWEQQVKAARRRAAGLFRRLHARLWPAQGQHSAAVLADLPRRKPLVNRQPWQTAEMPAVRVPEAQKALDPGDGLDDLRIARPYVPVPADEETRALYFGETAVTESVSAWRPAVTAEGERLASVRQP